MKLTRNTPLLVFLPLIVAIACTPSEKKSADSTDEVKDVSELTYQDVTEMVFSDEGERIEWHGEQLPNDALEYLAFKQEGKCGENGCGDALYLANTSVDKTIAAVVKGAYNINGDVGYIARKYIIPAGKQLSVGCSHLCYDGQAYKFDREVVSSLYDTTMVR